MPHVLVFLGLFADFFSAQAWPHVLVFLGLFADFSGQESVSNQGEFAKKYAFRTHVRIHMELTAKLDFTSHFSSRQFVAKMLGACQEAGVHLHDRASFEVGQ